MSGGAAPRDVLAWYYPGETDMNNQPSPLEVRAFSGKTRGGAFLEMTGGADTFDADFTSALRAYAGGGPTLVGGWFGGGGADPSVLVFGVSDLSSNEEGFDTAEAVQFSSKTTLESAAAAAPDPSATPVDITAFLVAPGAKKKKTKHATRRVKKEKRKGRQVSKN